SRLARLLRSDPGHGGSDAAKSPRHVDRRQDARTDVSRTVPGPRAYGEGRPELSVPPGSLEPGCLTCAEPHPRMQGRPLGRPSQWPPPSRFVPITLPAAKAYVEGPDHLAPLLGFVDDKFPERGRCH